MSNLKKTIAFCRVSTKNSQDTLSQRVAIQDYCNSHSIVIDEWLEDEGVSGYSVDIDDRESLNYIKELALNGKLDRLIIFNSDRIIRQTSGSSYLKTLALSGVKIISVTEGELYNDSEISELLNFIRYFQSNQESRKTSKRVRAGKKAAMEAGGYQGGKAPAYGYKVVDKKLVVDEEEAAIVRKLYEIYNAYGMKACIKWLDENGVDKRGGTWLVNSIYQMLTNSIYYGKRQSKKYDIPYDESLAIVSKEEWEHTQTLFKERRTRDFTKHTNKSNNALLESIFYHRCGDNIHKLYVDYLYNSENKRLVYRCSKCKIDRNRPKGIKYNYMGSKYHKIIEAEIKKVLNTLSVQELETEYCRTKAFELTTIEKEIKEIKSKLNLKNKSLKGAEDMLEKIFAGILDVDIYLISSNIKKIQSDIATLETQLNEKNKLLKDKEDENASKNRLLNKYKDFQYLWDIADDENKKIIIQELCDMIIIDSNNNIEIKLNI